MQKKLAIFLPVETSLRELPYKAPLAFILASLGHKVYIGRQQEIRLIWFLEKQFFYVDKSCAISKYKLFRDLKRCNGKIGIFCEEGLLYLTPEEYITQRVNKKTFSLVEKFWCWGKKQYEDISKIYGSKKLKIIDSPRFGLIYNYKKKKNKNAKNNKKILFLSSFAKINRVKILKKRGAFNKDLSESFYTEHSFFISKTKERFLKLIEKCLKKYKQHNFEIRTHPSEDLEEFDKLISLYNNFKYSKSPTSIEDISKADLIISPISTTSIEASLMGKDSLVYAPFYQRKYEPLIFKKICNIVRDDIKILKAIELYDYEEKSLNSNKYIQCNELDSYKILMKYAKEISSSASFSEVNFSSNFEFFTRNKYKIIFYLRKIIFNLNLKKESKYAWQKCKKISKDIIFEHSNKYLKYKSKDFQEKDYDIIEITKNVYEISKKAF